MTKISPLTKSEKLFELFLHANDLRFIRIVVESDPRPDYQVSFDGFDLIFEITQIDKDKNFGKISSRTPGSHIRSKISQKRKQIKWGTDQGIPSILLVNNQLDLVFQMFGTEEGDFIAAMYGEYTLAVNKVSGQITDAYHGKNQSLREDTNTSFSAVGRLYTRENLPKILIFENVFTKSKIPYDKLPCCFEVRRFAITT